MWTVVRPSETYGAAGNRRTVSTTYDDLNRAMRLQDANQNVTYRAYDEVGNKIARQYGNQDLTEYAYDALNRRVGESQFLQPYQSRLTPVLRDNLPMPVPTSDGVTGAIQANAYSGLGGGGGGGCVAVKYTSLSDVALSQISATAGEFAGGGAGLVFTQELGVESRGELRANNGGLVPSYFTPATLLPEVLGGWLYFNDLTVSGEASLYTPNDLSVSGSITVTPGSKLQSGNINEP